MKLKEANQVQAHQQAEHRANLALSEGRYTEQGPNRYMVKKSGAEEGGGRGESEEARL